MLTAIVRRSLAHAGVVVAASALLLVLGVSALRGARYGVFPEFAPPQVTVQTEAPGLAPRQVEALVTRPLETTLSGVLHTRALRSFSMQGLSKIQIVFDDGVDPYRQRQLVGEKLAAAATLLPVGIGVPTLSPLSSSTLVIEGIGFTSTRLSPRALQDFVRWTVTPRLLAVPGVADFNLWGDHARQLQVEIDPPRLAALHLALPQVLAAVRNATGIAGAGFVETPTQRVTLASDGQAATPAELGETVVRERAGHPPLLLRDVADIGYGDEPPVGTALIMGHPGVYLLVIGQYGANTLTTTRAVNAALDELQPLAARDGVAIHRDLQQPADFVRTALHALGRSLVIGILLVAATLLLFLREWRAALISFISIPLSLLAAAAVMRWLGQGLNTMTLGGLAVAVGVVVDDAVIDVENVLRRLRERPPAAGQRAAHILHASLEVRTPIVYATLVVLAVFLPVLALHGVQGAFFAPLALAFSLAVLASLGVALTVTPALCLLLLARVRHRAEPGFLTCLKDLQARAIRVLSRYPRALLGGSLVMGLVALAVLPLFGGELLPAFRESDFIVHVNAPPGTSLAAMQQLGQRLSAEILKLPGVASVGQNIGRAARVADTHQPNQSEIDVRLTAAGVRHPRRVERQLLDIAAAVPGAQYEVNTFLKERIGESLTGQTAPVVISVFGQHLAAIDRAAAAVTRVLWQVPGAAQVRLQAPPSGPLMRLRLRRHRLAAYGLQPLPVLQAIETAFQGATVAQIYHGDRSVPVAVVMDRKQARDPQQVGSLLLRSTTGALVPLAKVADVEAGDGRALILHEGGIRRQVITANPSTANLTGFVARARAAIATQVKLPRGVYLHFGGAAQAQAAADRALALAAVVALVAIVLLLFIAFGEARRVGLVLVNIPFALVGGVAALAATGGVLTLGALVGLVALFGVVARNAILLLAHYQHLLVDESQKWNLDTALRGARERLTPVLMTALLTALGLLPIAVSSGQPGHEVEGPMAIVLLGGLISSTLLSLLLLPGMALRWLQSASRMTQ
ncbi:MAG: efflux RND transporter permease subunit [Gammaproteobacteria bacterium]|nr:efflux RND transporter permease subunit [Gammaproteobacteria bacterium]